LLTALAIGLWLSALNAKYRDVAHVIPFLTQAGLILTPVAYPSRLVPDEWRALYALNPMASVVEGFRWALLGTAPAGGRALAGAAAVVLLLIGGLVYFRHMEGEFVDVV
jgi:lipopolysaccharide transport system permease protein